MGSVLATSRRSLGSSMYKHHFLQPSGAGSPELQAKLRGLQSHLRTVSQHECGSQLISDAAPQAKEFYLIAADEVVPLY